jgi:hypothetical protein
MPPLPSRLTACFYLGCRRCEDGSRYALRLFAESNGSLWGFWENPETGYAVPADSAGRLLPNPAGHFRARKLD